MARLHRKLRILFVMRHALFGSDPIGVMQLSAIAKLRGCETRLALAEDYLYAIRTFQPDLVAVSMMSTDVKALGSAIDRIKALIPEVPLILGGPHPTFQPGILNSTRADAVCIGEGDRAIVTIIERAESGDALENIPNIQTRSRRTPLGPLVENLDELPFVDREVLYDRLPEARQFKFRNFATSRGCPYRCSYCFNHSYNRLYRGLGPIVRKRSVDHLISEIQEVSGRYATEFVKFSDDSFIHRVDGWLEEFAGRYRNKVGLPFYCLIRPDRVSEEMVKLLKYAGCHSVFMSIETGNERLRKQVLQRDISDRQLVEAFDLFHRYGIKISTNSMLAIPTGSLQNDLETLDVNIRCKPDSCGFSICVPYPGTDMHRICEENGLLPGDASPEESAPDLNDFSIVTSFTDAEKRAQKNLSLLGLLVVKVPVLKTLVVGWLLRFRTNPLFYAVHFLISWYTVKRHIIPMRYSLRDWLVFGRRIAAESVRNVKSPGRSRSFPLKGQ